MKSTKLLALCISLLLLPILHAGSPDSTQYDPFTPGTKAIQVGIGKLLSLTSFQGTLFSYQKQLAPGKARRIGVSISSDLWNGDGTTDQLYYNSYDSTSNIENHTFDRNVYQISASISILSIRYKPVKNGFYYYRGIGPKIGFNYTDNHIGSSSRAYDYNQTLIKTGTIGCLGVLGTEWFVTNNLSLMAEYRSTFAIGYKYYNHNYKSYSYSGSYRSIKEITKGPTFNVTSGVKFGISIYL